MNIKVVIDMNVNIHKVNKVKIQRVSFQNSYSQLKLEKIKMVIKKRYDSKIIVSTIKGSKSYRMFNKLIYMNAPEEYIILLLIRMQFKILIALYSYKSQKLEGYEKEYMIHVGMLLLQKMRFSRD